MMVLCCIKLSVVNFHFFLFSGNSSRNPPSLTACAPALSALSHLIALVLLHKGLVTRRHVWLWLMDINLTEKWWCPCPISVILWDFFREAGCYVWCLSLPLKNHGFPVRAPALPQVSAAWRAEQSPPFLVFPAFGPFSVECRPSTICCTKVTDCRTKTFRDFILNRCESLYLDIQQSAYV